MRIEQFLNELRRFLSDASPGVLVISGRWGVGKTFAWNYCLEQAKNAKGGIASAKYAYVSLFGLTGLDDLKRAIVQQSVAREKIGHVPDMSSLESSLETIRASWRSAGIFARAFSPAAEYTEALERLGFFALKEQLICVDDLERKSDDLSMRDVLGLVSHLKEQKRCKVVILLNAEQLGDNEGEFRSQLEKVADTNIRFEPTSEEAAEIGVDKANAFSAKLAGNCIKLGIVNIRTIKKAERAALRLQEELRGRDERVLHQAVHTATLVTFAKQQPDIAPSLEFINKLNPYEGLFGDTREGVSHPEWRALLKDYGFVHMDAFDRVIFEGINDGHFNFDALAREANVLEQQLAAADDDTKFRAAWDLYHGSFDDNANEIMEPLAAAVRDRPRAVSPNNLSGTITLLKELAWPGDASKLISDYVANRNEPQLFWDLPKSAFGDEVNDPDVRAAFAAKCAQFPEAKSFIERLIELGETRSWSPDIIAFLAGNSVDTYYKTFKALRGTELDRAVRGGLLFKSTQGIDEHMKSILDKTEAALRRIGRESPLNLRRVLQRGVSVPTEETI
jgi:hypothetical protein